MVYRVQLYNGGSRDEGFRSKSSMLRTNAVVLKGSISFVQQSTKLSRCIVLKCIVLNRRRQKVYRLEYSMMTIIMSVNCNRLTKFQRSSIYAEKY